jgi:hypothetical protein
MLLNFPVKTLDKNQADFFARVFVPSAFAFDGPSAALSSAVC